MNHDGALAHLRAAAAGALDSRDDVSDDELARRQREFAAALGAQLRQLVSTAAAGDGRGELEATDEVVADLIGEYLRRLDGARRVERAIALLADAGPPSAVIDALAGVTAEALALDRVVVSRIKDGMLRVHSAHCEDAGNAAEVLARLEQSERELTYPLLEAELARRRRVELVSEPGALPRARQIYGPALECGAYLAAPLVLGGQVAGFLHGGRVAPPPELGIAEREAAASLTAGFTLVFERAVFRQRLRLQRQELRQVASWAEARTAELSDGAIQLGTAAAPVLELEREIPATQLRSLLTPREIDVLEQMAAGRTNADIARELVVSPGTVKFHVKNILRKLNATNRAQATSRYLQLALRSGGRAS